MHRRFLILIGLALLVGFGTRALAASWPDVSRTPYETAFSYLSEKKVVEGYPDGLGRPDGPLNRAEALKILVGLKAQKDVEALKKNMPPLPLFYDINQEAWYAPYIEAGFEKRMITGYPDKTFRPSQLLTTEEAITMALRAYDVTGSSTGAEYSAYIANRENQWFTAYINAAITKNLVMHSSRLEVGQVISRGRFFDLVYRLDALQSQGALVFKEPNQPVQQTASAPKISVPEQVLPRTHELASEQYFAISMPKLGIQDLTVIHPTDPFTQEGVLAPLERGVGHLFGYPGRGGKIMIYGHSSSYPWDISQYTRAFRKINGLDIGEKIYVTYDDSLHVYEVTRHQTIDADDISPFNDDGSGEELILYTCWPPDSIAQRYLVHAVPVETVALR